MIAVADRLIEFGEFVRMGDHLVGHGDNQAVQKRRGHARTLFARGVEEQGIGQGDRHFVARPEPGIGIGEGDEIMLAEIDMQMVLIAEMLDPGDAAGSALAIGFADVGVLGANADRRCALRHRDLGKQRARREVDRRAAQARGDIDVQGSS